MRKLSLFALIVFSTFLSGCSFSSDLIVMNLSDRPVEVRYRFKRHPGPVDLPKPAIKAIDKISRGNEWQELSAEQYVANSHSQTVTVTVAPNTAVRIDQLRGAEIGEYPFPIDEIVMRGAYGTVMLHGVQVRRSFVKEKKAVFSVSYR